MISYYCALAIVSALALFVLALLHAATWTPPR